MPLQHDETGKLERRREKRGKHYRKFEHSVESVQRTHQRKRRKLKLLLKTRPEKAMEQV